MVRLFFICLILLGCVPRQVLAPAPNPNLIEKTVDVFVATNRAGSEGRPTSDRSEQTSYAKLTVTIPSDREKGQITTPLARQPNQKTDFLLADVDTFHSKQEFSSALRTEFQERSPGDRVAMLYVHGFNSTYSEGVLRLAQLTNDLKLNSVGVHFAWPSAAHPLGYERDRGSALFSRDALEDLILQIKAAGARQIVLVAHSMGAFLSMETLRQMEIGKKGSVVGTLSGVVLISPDIDVDVFRTQASRIDPLPAPFAIFVADQDQALRLSARITGEQTRLGNIQDPRQIRDLKVTLIDVSSFADGGGLSHFVPGTAPELIEILSNAADVDGAFGSGTTGRSGILPGSVLTIQNVTEFVLMPSN